MALVRQEWEEGDRRLEEERGDRRRYERLLEQVAIVTDELRKQVGQTYTLAELVDGVPRRRALGARGGRGARPVGRLAA